MQQQMFQILNCTMFTGHAVIIYMVYQKQSEKFTIQQQQISVCKIVNSHLQQNINENVKQFMLSARKTIHSHGNTYICINWLQITQKETASYLLQVCIYYKLQQFESRYILHSDTYIYEIRQYLPQYIKYVRVFVLAQYRKNSQDNLNSRQQFFVQILYVSLKDLSKDVTISQPQKLNQKLPFKEKVQYRYKYTGMSICVWYIYACMYLQL
eukprot:TRINITY_DN7034_c0_g1_i3.p1 TRINITY_DN7034_c0_g1~~TRINITY_DN7034_c0_g1_i3.p1  ORF type:complete len:211 (+),score=-12.58 TRINITY_DN7034_c0_g1_i3:388-1020(+)